MVDGILVCFRRFLCIIIGLILNCHYNRSNYDDIPLNRRSSDERQGLCLYSSSVLFGYVHPRPPLLFTCVNFTFRGIEFNIYLELTSHYKVIVCYGNEVKAK